MRQYDHWIDGQSIPPTSGAYTARHSPYDNTGIASFASGTAPDVARATQAAKRALYTGEWAKASGSVRSRAIGCWADLIAADRERLAVIEAAEVGKPISLARMEVDYAVELARYAASLAWNVTGQLMSDSGPDQLGLVFREPRGVVGLILPWNYPLICLMFKLPYALAAGCTTVIKPSELTSGTTLEVARLAQQAGIPDGQINVITGTGEAVGDAMTTHPDIDMISFTGSTAIGRRIAGRAGEQLKHVTLELGGKGVNILFEDADLDAAINAITIAYTVNQGQECCAGSRILVHRSIMNEVQERLVRKAAGLILGDPMQDSTDLGPLVSERQMHRVLEFVEAGKREGASLLSGGARWMEKDCAQGFFVPPTIFGEVTQNMTIWREEIFGPVVALAAFDDTEMALSLANDTCYGLANGVWTPNIDKALYVTRKLRSGMVYVNTSLESLPQLPFGGMKDSGLGRENGARGLEEFLETKSAFIRLKDGC